MLPAGWMFAVGSSGVRAEKTGAARERYNRLSISTRRLVELWREAGAGDEATLAAVVASDPASALRLREIVRARAASTDDELLRRLSQFVTESEELVPAAAGALERGDIAAFGDVVRRSQHYAEQALGNQVPETIALVESALELGAAAASAFGAGFGGSVWALVRERDATAFADAWQSAYVARYPRHAGDATFFTSPAAAPASRIELTSAGTRS
jgi:galactokinase